MRRVSINACSRGYTVRIVNVSLTMLSVSSPSPCRGEAQRRGRAAGELLSLPREGRAERFEYDSADAEGVAVRALKVVQAVRGRPVSRGHVRPQLRHVREVGQCRVRRLRCRARRRLPARCPHVVHVRAACHDDGVHVGDELAPEGLLVRFLRATSGQPRAHSRSGQTRHDPAPCAGTYSTRPGAGARQTCQRACRCFP